MRAVAQRVSRAAVTVDGEPVGEIGRGLLVLVGAAHGDRRETAEVLADKLVGLRIFADADDRMNLSVTDIGGAVLLVSQFTLMADVRKGRRPSFTDAALPDVAAPLLERMADRIAAAGVPVATGRFGAKMAVELVNDGPVTIVVDVVEGCVV
jgi:D-tyrosyl-tRNA(Tyr) deacylase